MAKKVKLDHAGRDAVEALLERILDDEDDGRAALYELWDRLAAAHARNAELVAALRKIEQHGPCNDHPATCVLQIRDEARTALTRTPDQAAQRLAALERVAEAARNVGLETECIVTPPCGGCRACEFKAALAALTALDAEQP